MGKEDLPQNVTPHTENMWPVIPTPENDPGEYNKWLYGVEEVSAAAGIPQVEAEAYFIEEAFNAGYTRAEDALMVYRSVAKARHSYNAMKDPETNCYTDLASVLLYRLEKRDNLR